MSGIVNSAHIGVENLVYAVLSEETTATYGTPALISPAIKASSVNLKKNIQPRKIKLNFRHQNLKVHSLQGQTVSGNTQLMKTVALQVGLPGK